MRKHLKQYAFVSGAGGFASITIKIIYHEVTKNAKLEKFNTSFSSFLRGVIFLKSPDGPVHPKLSPEQFALSENRVGSGN